MESGELCLFSGPNIDAPSWDLAQAYCLANGLGYCRVVGQLIEEIPADDNYSPQWNESINHEFLN